MEGQGTYLMADFVPLAVQELRSLLEDRKVFGTDVAGERLPQHRQMGEIPSPTIKSIFKLLPIQLNNKHISRENFYLYLKTVITFLQVFLPKVIWKVY